MNAPVFPIATWEIKNDESYLRRELFAIRISLSLYPKYKILDGET
jgi:hypothetical protein